ncbi:MAG: PHP domain-containing protein [Arachnia sp.]
MSHPLDLTTDWHTHTTYSDGLASVTAMVEAAARRGVTRLHLTDHVREDSTWVGEYVREVERVRRDAPIAVVCGVETKILDTHGTLDLPWVLPGVEQVVVSDHRFPTRRGPIAPEEVRRQIQEGQIHAVDAVADLVVATSRAVFRHERVVVGHLFSILPKAGISLDLVTPDMLTTLAEAFRAAGAVVEVNEKWRTPGPRIIRELCARGVDLVPASDAHDADAIARWDYVADAAGMIVP